MDGRIRWRPPPERRNGPALDKPGRFSCQLTSDETANSNSKGESQAWRDFEIYSGLRLAEVDNPAIRFDRAWRRQVEWAFASFYRSFERLVAADNIGLAQ